MLGARRTHMKVIFAMLYCSAKQGNGRLPDAVGLSISKAEIVPPLFVGGP